MDPIIGNIYQQRIICILHLLKLCSGCLPCSSSEVAGSMVALLKGAGLLSNLKELAEQRRAEDEQVLTEKLEQVKGKN